ncbi:MAG: YbaN family protein [Alistipes sp.]
MKSFYILLGSLSLTLGIIGIFVPLLPTTPFLLLAATLFFNSSPRLYVWLTHHKYFGEYIRNYRENHAIPLRAKIVSLTLMWATMGYCAFGLTDRLWLQLLLACVAVGVTCHLLSFATLKK